MIKVNDITIIQDNFPDKTLKILNLPVFDNDNPIYIVWKYESDNELFTLQSIAKHYKSQGFILKELYMPYIPHARMDRVHMESELFTLKWFAEIINSLEFERVKVLDAHSSVALALIDRVCEIKPDLMIRVIFSSIITTYSVKPILFFLDAGGTKKYSYLSDELKTPYVYGEKNRDWDTGKILGLEIKGNIEALNEKVPILIVDDICSYGGSSYYGAKALKELGCGDIYAFFTHCENNMVDVKEMNTTERPMLLRLLNDRTVSRVYTTDSIFSSNNMYVEKFEL